METRSSSRKRKPEGQLGNSSMKEKKDDKYCTFKLPKKLQPSRNEQKDGSIDIAPPGFLVENREIELKKGTCHGKFKRGVTKTSSTAKELDGGPYIFQVQQTDQNRVESSENCCMASECLSFDSHEVKNVLSMCVSAAQERCEKGTFFTCHAPQNHVECGRNSMLISECLDSDIHEEVKTSLSACLNDVQGMHEPSRKTPGRTTFVCSDGQNQVETNENYCFYSGVLDEVKTSLSFCLNAVQEMGEPVQETQVESLFTCRVDHNQVETSESSLTSKCLDSNVLLKTATVSGLGPTTLTEQSARQGTTCKSPKLIAETKSIGIQCASPSISGTGSSKTACETLIDTAVQADESSSTIAEDFSLHVSDQKSNSYDSLEGNKSLEEANNDVTATTSEDDTESWENLRAKNEAAQLWAFYKSLANARNVPSRKYCCREEEFCINTDQPVISVKNLAQETKPFHLYAMFSLFGGVLSVCFVRCSVPETSTVTAYVIMSSERETELCINKLNNVTLHSKKLIVTRAELKVVDGKKVPCDYKNDQESVELSAIET